MVHNIRFTEATVRDRNRKPWQGSHDKATKSFFERRPGNGLPGRLKGASSNRGPKKHIKPAVGGRRRAGLDFVGLQVGNCDSPTQCSNIILNGASHEQGITGRHIRQARLRPRYP